MRWLNLMYRRWTSISLFVSIILGALIRFIVNVFGYSPEGVVAEVALDVTIAVFALAAPILMTLVALYPQIRLIMKMLGSAEEKGRDTVALFFDEELNLLSTTVSDMRGGGATLDPVEVAKWIRRCFRSATGKASKYVGTDSNVPSRFHELYGDYLRSQEGFLIKSSTDSSRILITDTAALREDQDRNPEDCDWFFKWHEEYGEHLHLKTVDRTVADEIRKRHDLAETTDVGLWEGHFALFFDPSRPGEEARVRLRMAFPKEKPYEQCESFLQELQKASVDATKELPWFTDALAKCWKDFVVPDDRLRSEGDFLLNRVLAGTRKLPKDVRVLDAAMGIGVETVFLLKQGYFVVGNEIEEGLRRKAEEYARSRNIRLPRGQTTSANWLTLQNDFSENAFDVVLVLGNSLCLLAGPTEVSRALGQFRRVLAPGGLLVADERNFEYICDSWAQIGDDPWRNFRYSRHFVYCGKSIGAVPTHMLDGRVVFTYSGIENGRPRGKPLGHLSMYPFNRGELRELIGRAGFVNTQTYSDVTKDPSPDFDDTADFYTYIAVSPD